MKHFKKPDNTVWAFEEDGSQDDLITSDMVLMSTSDVEMHVNPPPTLAERQSEVTAEIQEHLDAFARTRGYDSIMSACTYATSTVPKFAAEGQYCVQARDTVWAAAYAILADVQAGVRAMPTTAQALAELPTLTWPV